MRTIITILGIFLISINSFGQTLDTETKNKIKVKFAKAELNFKASGYEEALTKLIEIEELLQGNKLASILNLKTKCLVELKQYENAQNILDDLLLLDRTEAINNDIEIYLPKIEKGLRALAELKKKEIATENAFKHFIYSECDNTYCNGGQVKKTKKIICGGSDDYEKYNEGSCEGKGYTLEGYYRCTGCPDPGPNAGRKKHKRCNGTGKIKKLINENCSVCLGANKILTYVGEYNFSKNEIKEIIKLNKQKIIDYIKQ